MLERLILEIQTFDQVLCVFTRYLIYRFHSILDIEFALDIRYIDMLEILMLEIQRFVGSNFRVSIRQSVSGEASVMA